MKYESNHHVMHLGLTFLLFLVKIASKKVK